MDALPIDVWSNYLTAMAGSAATLSGLVFVAVSINLTRVLAIPGLTGRAAESIVQLLGVVAIATTVLIPRQPPAILGSEVLALGIFLWLFQTKVQIRYLRTRTGHPRRWLLIRIAQTQFAAAPFLVSGILLMRQSAAGLYWLAPGFLFSLLAGVANAWVLLIEILR